MYVKCDTPTHLRDHCCHRKTTTPSISIVETCVVVSNIQLFSVAIETQKLFALAFLNYKIFLTAIKRYKSNLVLM